MYYLPLGILLLVVLGLILGFVDGMREVRRRMKLRAIHAAASGTKS
jgi:F0F1-type ATP synthase assembly protein I